MFIGHIGLAPATKPAAPRLFVPFVVVLAMIYLASVFAPPPPSERALAVTGLLGWSLVALGYWIDRHRVTAMRHIKESRQWRITN